VDKFTKDRRPNEQSDRAAQLLAAFIETFGLSYLGAILAIVFASLAVIAAVWWFISSAPPRTLTITSGPPGSTFQRTAERYRDILASNGVTLKILPSQGSMENLDRLADPAFKVDIGFVQTGASNAVKAASLFSLGSIAYQPLLIFYRSTTNVNLLSDFAGKRLAIGPVGSGTRTLAMTLLSTNGVSLNGPTTLLDLDAGEAAKALLDGQVDAVFLMGDSASSQIMRSLLRAPDTQIFDFQQADAYTRRFGYLNKLQLPRGAIDFGKDMPSRTVNLIAPTVELVSRSSLHPALSDLLLETAHQVHGRASLLQRQGEFPAPLEHEFPISPNATTYYKSGKGFFYRSLPFWMASLVHRTLVAFVPMILVLIPVLRFIPTAYKWRMQLKIYRWYRGLLNVEQDSLGEMTEAKRGELTKRIDYIEKSVNQMKVPASFAGQFYILREHIGTVRDRLGNMR